MLYTVQDTTMTALGDAVRSKTFKHIFKEDVPNEPIYSIDFDSADYDMNQWYDANINPYEGSYIIDFDLAELAGDSIYMYEQKMPAGRPKLLINLIYESNMAECLDWELGIGTGESGIWNQRYIGQKSTFLTKEYINLVVDNITTLPRNLHTRYSIILQPLISAIKNGLHFKFYFDVRIMTSDDKFVYLNTFTPAEMTEQIEGLMTIPEEAFTITGNCDYKFYAGGWNWLINTAGDKIITKDITSLDHMFQSSSSLEKIPFDINCGNITYGNMYMSDIFNGCEALKQLPMIHNYEMSAAGAPRMFYNCKKLRNFPEGFADDWYFSQLNTSTYGSINSAFYDCYSLRELPQAIVSKCSNLATRAYSSSYQDLFAYCYALNQIQGLDISNATLTSNVFSNTLVSNYRLKDFTFETNEDGTAKTAKWKGQTIDLTRKIGYALSSPYILNYNSGITANKEVTDDATYQTLKNDPDWFSCDINYSSYNHDSAVNTINSLPDCSGSGGTNTIKFEGQSGALTDGGAINTLTEEEIALATVKAWTVSLV